MSKKSLKERVKDSFKSIDLTKKTEEDVIDDEPTMSLVDLYCSEEDDKENIKSKKYEDEEFDETEEVEESIDEGYVEKFKEMESQIYDLDKLNIELLKEQRKLKSRKTELEVENFRLKSFKDVLKKLIEAEKKLLEKVLGKQEFTILLETIKAG